jgi:hypothetical protein
LGETGIQMLLEGIWIRKVDCVRLVGVFRDVGEVESEGFAESTELDLSFVFKAEFERLLGNLLEWRE